MVATSEAHDSTKEGAEAARAVEEEVASAEATAEVAPVAEVGQVAEAPWPGDGTRETGGASRGPETAVAG
eukprot:1946812-Prymnesium_polylepis.1